MADPAQEDAGEPKEEGTEERTVSDGALAAQKSIALNIGAITELLRSAGYLRTLSCLEQERRDHHSVGTLQCTICGQILSSRGNLKRHMQSKHAGAKEFVCDCCSKRFARSDELRLHMERMHSREETSSFSGLGNKRGAGIAAYEHNTSSAKRTPMMEGRVVSGGPPRAGGMIAQPGVIYYPKGSPQPPMMGYGYPFNQQPHAQGPRIAPGSALPPNSGYSESPRFIGGREADGPRATLPYSGMVQRGAQYDEPHEYGAKRFFSHFSQFRFGQHVPEQEANRAPVKILHEHHFDTLLPDGDLHCHEMNGRRALSSSDLHGYDSGSDPSRTANSSPHLHPHPNDPVMIRHDDHFDFLIGDELHFVDGAGACETHGKLDLLPEEVMYELPRRTL